MVISQSYHSCDVTLSCQQVSADHLRCIYSSWPDPVTHASPFYCTKPAHHITMFIRLNAFLSDCQVPLQAVTPDG